MSGLIAPKGRSSSPRNVNPTGVPGRSSQILQALQALRYSTQDQLSAWTAGSALAQMLKVRVYECLGKVGTGGDSAAGRLSRAARASEPATAPRTAHVRGVAAGGPAGAGPAASSAGVVGLADHHASAAGTPRGPALAGATASVGDLGPAVGEAPGRLSSPAGDAGHVLNDRKLRSEEVLPKSRKKPLVEPEYEIRRK